MNKKAQNLAVLVVEFMIVFFLLLELGPIIHEQSSGIPFGFVLRILFPGPEEAILGAVKALIGSTLITGITGKLIN